MKVVVNGLVLPQACANLFKSSGVKNENIIMCDSKRIIYKGQKILINSNLRLQLIQALELREAMKNADVFLVCQLRMLFQKK